MKIAYALAALWVAALLFPVGASAIWPFTPTPRPVAPVVVVPKVPVCSPNAVLPPAPIPALPAACAPQGACQAACQAKAFSGRLLRLPGKVVIAAWHLRPGLICRRK